MQMLYAVPLCFSTCQPANANPTRCIMLQKQPFRIRAESMVPRNAMLTMEAINHGQMDDNRERGRWVGGVYLKWKRKSGATKRTEEARRDKVKVL